MDTNKCERVWSTKGNIYPAFARWFRSAKKAGFKSVELGILNVSVEDVRRDLRGKNLACFCRLDQPCHADVLLEIANTSEKTSNIATKQEVP